MKNSGLRYSSLLSFFFLLVVSASITLACGTSSSSGSRTLQSVTLSPAIADAQDYPGGQVPFTATGFYSAPPSPVTPVTGSWGACYQNAQTNAVTVSKTGLAQCASGAVGTYTVFASLPTNCTVITACGGGCQISGQAQLTCP